MIVLRIMVVLLWPHMSKMVPDVHEFNNAYMRICIVWVGPFVYTAMHRMGGPLAYRPANTSMGFNIEWATKATTASP
jgi:hypothetical protein